MFKGRAFLQIEKIELGEATDRVVAVDKRRDPALVAVNIAAIYGSINTIQPRS